jgi:hypothetical protein
MPAQALRRTRGDPLRLADDSNDDDFFGGEMVLGHEGIANSQWQNLVTASKDEP